MERAGVLELPHGFLPIEPAAAASAPMFHSRYFEQDQEDQDEEPVHPLDLRICKVNESISRFNTDVLRSETVKPESSTDSSANNIPPLVAHANHHIPVTRYLSPMTSAFPGQIPPDRRIPIPPDQQENPSAAALVAAASEAAVAAEAAASEANWKPLGIRPLSELTEQSNACKIVEAATSTWRYSPYEKLTKSERASPSPIPINHDQDHSLTRNNLIMRNYQQRGIGFSAKSTFLHHVLKHKEHVSPTVEVKKELPTLSSLVDGSSDFVHHHEVDRRMELLDQTFRICGQDYSPPPSPLGAAGATSSSSRGILGSMSSNPEHDLVLKQREFLMRLHHFSGPKYPPPPHHHHQGSNYPTLTSSSSMHSFQNRWNVSSKSSPPPLEPMSPESYGDFRTYRSGSCSNLLTSSSSASGSANDTGKGKRGRPRKHAVKIPLPPLYVFIRNLLHNRHYNPRVVTWISESQGIFKVNNTADFAKTWGLMKSNRNEEMTYEKMSRAMRYHYGNEKQGRKGHLAMVKEKRLVYRFGELAINWRVEDVAPIHPCQTHALCGGSMCLWRKE